jgi:hypothetical protein
MVTYEKENLNVRKRSISVLLALTATCLFGANVGVGAAGAAAVPKAVSPDGITAAAAMLCADQSPLLCLRTSGTIGSVITSDNWTARSIHQETELVLDTASCNGGHVESGAVSCPFKLGSGLNAKYSGDGIYHIQFFNEPGAPCAAANGSNWGVFLEACSSSGTDFVFSADPDGGGYDVINPFVSNSSGDDMALWEPEATNGYPVGVNPLQTSQAVFVWGQYSTS